MPPTPNWLIAVSWLAADGALVKKGDRVVEFDSSSLTETIEEKRISVQRAESELASEAARGDIAIAEKAMEVQNQRAEVDKALVEASVPADLLPARDSQKKQLDLLQKREALTRAEQDLAHHAAHGPARPYDQASRAGPRAARAGRTWSGSSPPSPCARPATEWSSLPRTRARTASSWWAIRAGPIWSWPRCPSSGPCRCAPA